MQEMVGSQPTISAMAVADMARLLKVRGLPSTRMSVSAARAQGAGPGV